jgi:hypothetical protein
MGEQAKQEPQAGPGEPAPPDDGTAPGLGAVEPVQSATPVESDRISPELEPEKQAPAPENEPVGSEAGESTGLVAARAMLPPSDALVGLRGLPPPAGHRPNGPSRASGLSTATVINSAAARLSSASAAVAAAGAAAAAIGRSAGRDSDRSATAAVNTAAYEAITTAVTATAGGLSSARYFTQSGGQAVANGLGSSPAGGWTLPRVRFRRPKRPAAAVAALAAGRSIGAAMASSPTGGWGLRFRRPKRPAAAVAALAAGRSIGAAMASSPTGGWRTHQMRLRRRPRIPTATENTGASATASAQPANLAGLRSKPIPLRKRVFASSSTVHRTSATVPTSLDMETATNKAMEEALAIANEPSVVAASGAAITANVANAPTTAAEPMSAAAIDGESVRTVTAAGGYPGNGDASTQSSDRSSTVAVDEGPSYSEDGEVSDATTVAAGEAESATGGDDATTVDEAAPADELPDDVADDDEAANDWVTPASGTAAGEAAATAEEAAAPDERDIAGETAIAADAMTTGDEADATHPSPTDQDKTAQGWFSPAELSSANSSAAAADEATDQSVGKGDGANTAGGMMVRDDDTVDLMLAGGALTTDGQPDVADVTAADGSAATADEVPDGSAGLGDGEVGLLVAGEALTTDGRPDVADVTAADGSTATTDEVTDESAAMGDGAMRFGDGAGAMGLVIAAEVAAADQPSRTADSIPEDNSTTIEADADATNPILITEATTTDRPSDADEAATEDEETTTMAAVVADRAVSSDEAKTPDQGDITSAATTLDDTTTIIPAVRDEATTLMPPVSEEATTIIPAVPDDIPVVPPLGRLSLADQAAFRESGTQTTRTGTGAAAPHAPTASPTETAKPKAAAVPVTLPAPTPAPATPVRRRPRRARLKVTRADPWSVMKIAFVLSLAAGIMTVVAVAFLWMALDAAGIFSKVGETVNSVTSGGEDKGFDLEGYLTLSRVLGITGIIAAVEVVVMTALATLLAFMYNVSSGMVGGIEVTLAEDD